MEIKYDLLPKQKTQKHNLRVDIDLYPYAAELYIELDRIGIINRIKEIPQLGVIKVKKKLAKSRFDYVMLQLYLPRYVYTTASTIVFPLPPLPFPARSMSGVFRQGACKFVEKAAEVDIRQVIECVKF